MYCPRCAKEFAPETSFCRTCGLSLDGISQIVNGEAETAPEVRSKPNFNMMRIGIGLFILGLVLGLLNAAFRSFGLFPEEYGKVVFLVVVAMGMLCLGAGFIFPKKYYVKKKAKETLSPPTGKLDQLPSADRNIDLVPPMSVTEKTTRDLKRS